MNNILRSISVLILFLALSSCEKELAPMPASESSSVDGFAVSVARRTATGALLQWTSPSDLQDADKIRYKVYLNEVEIAANIEGLSFQIENLNSEAISGRVCAYVSNGTGARAIPLAMHFVIPPFNTGNSYNYVNGYYKVTETSKNLNTGAVSNYVFVGRLINLNNSNIRFLQNQRVPTTWWTTNFEVQVYPNLNDSLIGSGITPRGRILSQDSIRMSYLFGTTVVYEVKQIWQKFANPADTATVSYTYPNFPGMINTMAGNNTSGSGSGTTGDGGPALSAALVGVWDVIADNAGNFYFTDGTSTNYSIRKVDSNGIISRYAGNNTSGYSGDGGPANAAQLNYAQALAFDYAGNLLISDAGNRIIRRVNSVGIITTIAGIPGSYGYSGDGGQATSAQLASPAGLCTDAAGNIYYADQGRHVVRKIDINGIITTIAGIAGTNGSYGGDGGPATSALLNSPTDVCIDPSGNLYISDRGNHAIRKIDLNGIISTIAGIGGFLNSGYTGDGGPATSAKLSDPQSVSLDPVGNLYISDNSNNRIRMVNSNGIISTIAGIGQAALLGDGPAFWGGDYGPATGASIANPKGIFHINNKLYIATSYRIRRVVF